MSSEAYLEIRDICAAADCRDPKVIWCFLRENVP